METVVTASYVDPNGGPPYNDLFRVTASNVTIDGFVIDGNNSALDQTSAVVAPNGINIDAADGISNTDISGDQVPVGSITVSNDIIQNFSFGGTFFDNGTATSPPPTTSGSLFQGNVVSNNLIDGLDLFDNFFGDIKNNTVIVPADDSVGAGIDVQNFHQTTGTMEISGNTITVGQDSFGVFSNQIYAGSITETIKNNIIQAASGVTGTDDVTFGVALWGVGNGGQVIEQNDTIGTTGGQFSRGIDVWQAGTGEVSISNTTIGSATAAPLVGINFDNVNYAYGGAGDSTISLTDDTVTGGTYALRVRADVLAAAPTISGSNTVSGSVEADLSGGTYTGGTDDILVSAPSASAPYTATVFTTAAPTDGTTITGGPIGILVSGRKPRRRFSRAASPATPAPASVWSAAATWAGCRRASSRAMASASAWPAMRAPSAPSLATTCRATPPARGQWHEHDGGCLCQLVGQQHSGGSASSLDRQCRLHAVPQFDGTDTAAGTPGFQGDFSYLNVTAAGPQVQAGGRINEAIGDLTAGGTVNVLAGTYAESVLVNKALTLQGAGATTIIDATGLTTGIHVTASNVTLTELKVQGDSSTNQGIWIDASGGNLTNESITDDTITGTSTNIANYGIRADIGGSANTISTLTVTGDTVSKIGASPGYGLFLNGVNGSTISGNSFSNLANDTANYPGASNPTGVAISSASIGVFVTNSSSVTVDNTNSYSNLTLAGYFSPTTTTSTFTGAAANFTNVPGYYVNGNSPSNTMSVPDVTQSVSTNNVAAGTGANFTPLGNVPNLFATIQAAIDFSASGRR